MLFVLTGEIQTGKTRWLNGVIDKLKHGGVSTWGVLAPGQWNAERDERGEIKYTKIGIDNLLLPGQTRLEFGRIKQDYSFKKKPNCCNAPNNFEDKKAHMSRANLAWEFNDETIEKVNTHFQEIRNSIKQGDFNQNPSFLVVDELGPLELLHEEGIDAAVNLLDDGPSAMFPHALIVVRKSLVETAVERFERTPWEKCFVITPSDEASDKICTLFNEKK